MQRRKQLIFGSLAFLFVIGLAFSFSQVMRATVTVSWSYDYKPLPACGGPLAKSCIDHFEIKDFTDPDNPRLLGTVQNPVGATGKVDNIGTTFTYTGPFGLRTIVVVAIGRDGKGGNMASNPYAARKDVQIRPRMVARAQIN